VVVCDLYKPLIHSKTASASRLEKMLNRAVRVVYGLRKFDHVSALRRKLDWLSVPSLIQHQCLLKLYRHYHAETENTILLQPPIKFGRQSSYETKTAPYFAVPCRFRLSFTQRFFRSKGTYWWNNVPTFVFEQTDGYFGFKEQTFRYLLDNDCFV